MQTEDFKQQKTSASSLFAVLFISIDNILRTYHLRTLDFPFTFTINCNYHFSNAMIFYYYSSHFRHSFFVLLHKTIQSVLDPNRIYYVRVKYSNPFDWAPRRERRKTIFQPVHHIDFSSPKPVGHLSNKTTHIVLAFFFHYDEIEFI